MGAENTKTHLDNFIGYILGEESLELKILSKEYLHFRQNCEFLIL